MKVFSLLFVAGLALTSAQPTNNDGQTHNGGGGVDGDGTGGIPTLDPNDPALSQDPLPTQAECNVDNCITCLEDNVCSACDAGFASDSGACVTCEVDNCAVCNNDAASCSQCAEGYRVETETGTTTMGTEGPVLYTTSTCVECTLTNCGECVVDSEGIETCDECAQGAYKTDDDTCELCGDSCLECASVDVEGNIGGCLLCEDDLETDLDGSCVNPEDTCNSHCLECEGQGQCKTCEDGYSVQLYNNGLSTGCAPCPPNCASCADATTCDVCETDYILDGVSGSCATQEQVYANVCDCRTTVNDGCTCPGDETTSKDGCCDAGGMCGGDDGVCALFNNNQCDDFDNCAYCFGQSFCGACDNGYYKANGHAWGTCTPLPDGWDLDTCEEATLYNDKCDCDCGGVDPECATIKATTCEGDSVYCDASGECAECTVDGCSYCGNGDNADTCMECMDGYDINDDATCDKCDIDGCSSCTAGIAINPDTNQVETTTVCKSCMDGYYGSVIEATCTACDDENCQECNADGCNKCNDSFSLDAETGTCNSCSDNCLQCGANQCNRCESGFDIVNGGCTAQNDCGDNCATCQRGGMCKICESGYYVGAGTNGKCVACMDNCDSCRDADSCQTCADDYDFDINEGACLAAGDCLADICDCRADSEFAVNSGCTCLEDESSAKKGCCNSDCGLCADLCADYDGEPCSMYDNCDYCFEQTYCMECSEGYYQAEYHGDCIALPDGWDLELCPINMLNNNECDCGCGGYDTDCDEWPADTCDSGEYCSTEGTCAECVLAGCMHCSNGDGHLDGTCLECTAGHYQDDEGNCVDCDLTGCEVCLLQASADGTDDQYSCKQCADGYYMNNEDLCSLCAVTNCGVCSLDGSCEECEDGYSLSDAGACTSCPDNCLDCTGDASACKRCDDNYEVLDDGSCGATGEDCGNNCLVCGAQGVCKQCLNTYYRNDDGDCSSCLDNCGSCSTATTCSECETGYGWVDETSSCDAYSDALEYCDDMIKEGVLDEDAVCECLGWECAEKAEDTTVSLQLRR